MAANKRDDGTSEVMAAASMCQDFTTDDHVFLVGELELGTGGAVQGVEGAGCEVQDDGADGRWMSQLWNGVGSGERQYSPGRRR